MIEVHGFNQKKAIEMGLTNDDLLFLRWYTYVGSVLAEERVYNKETNSMLYYWSYEDIFNDLPIIFNDTKENNIKKLQKMFEGSISKMMKFQFLENKICTTEFENCLVF